MDFIIVASSSLPFYRQASERKTASKWNQVRLNGISTFILLYLWVEELLRNYNATSHSPPLWEFTSHSNTLFDIILITYIRFSFFFRTRVSLFDSLPHFQSPFFFLLSLIPFTIHGLQLEAKKKSERSTIFLSLSIFWLRDGICECARMNSSIM